MQLAALSITALLAATAALGSPAKRAAAAGIRDDFIEIMGRHPDGHAVPVYISSSFTPREHDDDDGARLAPREFSSDWIYDDQHHKLCGDITYEDLLPLTDYRTPASAGACSAVIDALGTHAGWFNVSGASYAGVGTGYGTLASAGLCTLGVYREDGREDSFGVGDGDATGMLRWAVARFAAGDKVHVDGEGRCGPVWFGFEIYGAENTDQDAGEGRGGEGR